jgi:hypothetical protein
MAGWRLMATSGAKLLARNQQCSHFLRAYRFRIAASLPGRTRSQQSALRA